MFIRHSDQKKTDGPKKLVFADKIDERYGEIEHRGGKVLQRWCGSGGNVRLSHLLMSFLLIVICQSINFHYVLYFDANMVICMLPACCPVEIYL